MQPIAFLPQHPAVSFSFPSSQQFAYQCSRRPPSLPPPPHTHAPARRFARDILHVDAAGLVVRCEPFVTVSQLTARLLPLGLTLPCVPELDDLTIGMCRAHILQTSVAVLLFAACPFAQPSVSAGGVAGFHPTPRLVPLLLFLPGGLLMGVGVESSSHKHGLLADAVLAFEVIVASGALVRAQHVCWWGYARLGVWVRVLWLKVWV
jgi:hypothetical protein